MKYILPTFIIILLFSCQNQVEKSNERLKTVIFKKNREIQKNYAVYKRKNSNSGYANLLSSDRLKSDKELVESKKIITRVEENFFNFSTQNQKLVYELKSLFDSIKPTKNISQKDILKMKSELDKSIKITKSTLKVDSTSFDLTKKIITLLDGDCKYEIIDNQFVFYTQKCMLDYNVYKIKLESLIMKEEHKVLKRKIDKIILEN